MLGTFSPNDMGGALFLWSYKIKIKFEFYKKTTWDIFEIVFISAKNLWIENQNIFLYQN
jgi:hypothetical protein